jgi:hypothetical protein
VSFSIRFCRINFFPRLSHSRTNQNHPRFNSDRFPFRQVPLIKSSFSHFLETFSSPPRNYFPFDKHIQFPIVILVETIIMAGGNRSSLFVGLSALFYLALLFSPLAFFQTAHAQSDQDPLQANYGTGVSSKPPSHRKAHNANYSGK